MSDRKGLLTRLVARVKALLPSDWRGKAGQRFRRTTSEISKFADEHNLHGRELADEPLHLGE